MVDALLDVVDGRSDLSGSLVNFGALADALVFKVHSEDGAVSLLGLLLDSLNTDSARRLAGVVEAAEREGRTAPLVAVELDKLGVPLLSQAPDHVLRSAHLP